MSPTVATLPPQARNPKGKKVPGRRGRFDPDQPLHMTTRRAGKKSIDGSVPSVDGSVEGSEARRSSLEGERPVTANSNGSKGTYASEYSPPQPVPDVDTEMSEAASMPSFKEAINGERRSRPPSHTQQTSPPNYLKRKRSSPFTPPAVVMSAMAPSTHTKTEAPLPKDLHEGDTVEVVPPDMLSDRDDDGDDTDDEGKEGSAGSFQSQGAVHSYDAVVGTSVDVTPMLSEQPSPATSGTPDEDEPAPHTPIAKPLVEALHEVVNAKKDDVAEAEQPEDMPMLDATQVIEDADELDDQVRTDEEGRMIVRKGKFGGRRRAQHANINIEVAMRRQAQLKTAYRAIARSQKNVLAEVTQRTIDELEANATHHTEVAAYEDVMRDLNAALEKRKAAIQVQHEMRLKQLKVTWEGNQASIIGSCRQQLDDIEQNKVDQLQYEFLRIARNAQLEDPDETEDEDEVIPRLKRTAYHFKRGAGLDTIYDSRSRMAMETQRATKDMQARYNMFEMLKDLPDDDQPQKRKGFTIMDGRPRTAASTNREGQTNLDVLAAAGAEETRRAEHPPIPNEQAFGLKMLSDLATRPSIASITSGRPPSSVMFSGQASAGTPPLQIQVPPRGPSPIQVQMSPRTQHAMGNRFDSNQMPPPLTPRQDIVMSGDRSPEMKRHERQPSTPGREDRTEGFQPQSKNEPFQSPRQQPNHEEKKQLHRRISSRDNAALDSLFGAPSPRAFPAPEHPAGFRQFDMPGGPRRRAISHSDPAPPFGIRSDPTPDPRCDYEQREPGRADNSDKAPGQSLRFDPVRSETPRWPDQPSEAGASNGHGNETGSERSERTSLADISAPQYTPGTGQSATAANKNAESETKKVYQKTNVKSRQGKSRKQWSKEKKHSQQMENGRPESAGTPTMNSSGFMDSPATSMRSHSPYLNGPPHPLGFPADYPRPPGPFGHNGPWGQPPPGFPPHFGPDHRRSSDFSFFNHLIHRDTFGPPHSGPPPPPFFNPQHHHQPPPPGVAPEQYQQRMPFGPPGPSPFGPPPGLPQQQQPSGRGLAIAPASGGGYGQGGVRPATNNQLPAFAQQQQQSGNSERRRRTQSDVGFAKFQPLWQPKPSQR